jgi:ferrous iron transport protein B
MMDMVRKRGIQIDIAALSRELGCPVIALEAHRGSGVDELKRTICVILSEAKDLQGGTHKQILPPAFAGVRMTQEASEASQCDDTDILLADKRYRFIETLCQQYVSHKAEKKRNWTSRIDNIVLHRIFGIPIFLAVMYLLFLFSIDVGGIFQKFFDQASQFVFVNGTTTLLTSFNAPAWLVTILANGVGKGINTIVTFIPVIGALFLFLALLEDSGYMARAAFVVDRLMRVLGLPGKAFVPMMVGFGCNVPAVMAARSLENKRDRIISIMMSPFMSCGARLAIYAVFTAAFFPSGSQHVVFALYLIGISMAVLTGYLLRHTFLTGDPAPLVMELPSYHVPRAKTLLLHAWQRLRDFVFRAGKLILPVCVIVGALNSGVGDSTSLLANMGHWITPIFSPMGIQADNWPATVGLITGVLAKEVVVGTLNTLYGGLSFVQQFDGQIGAFAYLLFVLLYFPCVSTMAAMVRELHRGWAVFSACWNTGVAYAVAVIFYQAATFLRHPLSSIVWIVSLSLIFLCIVSIIRWLASRQTYTVPMAKAFSGCTKTPACASRCFNCPTK